MKKLLLLICALLLQTAPVHADEKPSVLFVKNLTDEVITNVLKSKDTQQQKTERFEKFEIRAAFEKPELLDGLVRLKTAMGEALFDKYINPLENVNLSGSSMLILAGQEKLRTALVSRWLPVIKAAFNVGNVRVVGGGRGGLDAY